MSRAPDDEKLPARDWLAHWLSDQSFWEGVVQGVLSTGILAGVGALIAYFTAQNPVIRAVGLAIGAAAIGVLVGLIAFSLISRSIAKRTPAAESIPGSAGTARATEPRHERRSFGITVVVSLLVAVAAIVGAIYGLGLFA
jgi:ABC-type uncharacterized transport system permease subunit